MRNKTVYLVATLLFTVSCGIDTKFGEEMISPSRSFSKQHNLFISRLIIKDSSLADSLDSRLLDAWLEKSWIYDKDGHIDTLKTNQVVVNISGDEFGKRRLVLGKSVGLFNRINDGFYFLVNKREKKFNCVLYFVDDKNMIISNTLKPIFMECE